MKETNVKQAAELLDTKTHMINQLEILTAYIERKDEFKWHVAERFFQWNNWKFPFTNEMAKLLRVELIAEIDKINLKMKELGVYISPET